MSSLANCELEKEVLSLKISRGWKMKMSSGFQ